MQIEEKYIIRVRDIHNYKKVPYLVHIVKRFNIRSKGPVSKDNRVSRVYRNFDALVKCTSIEKWIEEYMRHHMIGC